MAKKKTKKKEVSKSQSLAELAEECLGTAQMGVNFWLPTGLIGLDLIISNGLGLPGGKMIEIYGDAASGKTALCLSLAKQMQAKGGEVLWLDAEAAFSLTLAENLIDVDVDNNFSYKVPDCLEDAIECIEVVGTEAAKRNTPLLIVLDSIAALSTRAQSIDGGEFSKTKRVMGSAANTISWFANRGILRKLSGSSVILVIVNQTRTKVDFHSYGGPQKTTPGGLAISFYSRVRLLVSQTKLKEGEDIVGKLMKVEVKKNSFGPDGRYTYIPFYPSKHNGGYGMDPNLAMFNYLVGRKAVKRSGAYYEIAGTKKWRKDWITEMREVPELASSIKDLVVSEFYKEHNIDG